MFLDGLKAKSILRKIEKSVNERELISSHSPVATIAILQERRSPFDPKNVKSLLDMLGVQEEQVTILEYVKNLTREQKEEQLLYSEKQLGWKGVFKTKSLKDFEKKPFDILLSYYISKELSLNAMTALSQAKFKVGITSSLEEINDLTIHVKKGQETVFISELEKYLRILKVIN